MEQIGIGIIGSGMIVLANHLPGFAMCPQAKVVALCDSNSTVLENASRQSGIAKTYTDYQQLIEDPAVNAVVVATPNYLHAPIVLAATAAGKHVFCEKPLAMNLAETVRMLEAARAANVRHMTAFTYRFVPAMHYMAHQVKAGAIGQPYHFRAQRFQDWGSRNLGWRQIKSLAGTGELGDMLSHRIDFGHALAGPITRLVGNTRRFIDDRGGKPSDLDDWVAVLADFTSGATGVLESTKLATGRGEGGKSRDFCEINGSEGTLIYHLGTPNEVQIGNAGASGLSTIPVPEQFLKWPGSPRDVRVGDPVQTFRYDQDFEFVDAILKGRDCVPSFVDGVRAQAVMDAIVTSTEERTWVDVAQVA